MWRIRIFPTIDLFATRINTQLRPFVSYRTDLNCVAVNAFLINWGKETFYAFPPFACLSKVLQKILRDIAKRMLIAPDWLSQPFYLRLIEIFLQIISIPPKKKNLHLPSQSLLLHPRHRKLSFIASLVDGAMIY